MTTIDNSKEVKDILIKARVLIENPEGWTQGTFARNEHNEQVDEFDEDAVCYCSWGAISKSRGYFVERSNATFDLLSKFMNNNIADFNDTHTHAEVLSKFDEAIKSLEQ